MTNAEISVQPANPDKTHPRAKIIPVPPVTDVPSYRVDYLPVHRINKAPRDPKDIWDTECQEYDLDVQDMEFLNDVNQGGTQERLSSRQLEAMLWALEVASNAAHESSLQNTGAYCSVLDLVPCTLAARDVKCLNDVNQGGIQEWLSVKQLRDML
jgi:hypothetical protein